MSKYPSQQTLGQPPPSSVFLREGKGHDCFLVGFLGHICKRFGDFLLKILLCSWLFTPAESDMWSQFFFLLLL